VNGGADAGMVGMGSATGGVGGGGGAAAAQLEDGHVTTSTPFDDAAQKAKNVAADAARRQQADGQRDPFS